MDQLAQRDETGRGANPALVSAAPVCQNATPGEGRMPSRLAGETPASQRGGLLTLRLLLLALAGLMTLAIVGAVVQPQLKGQHSFIVWAIFSRQFLTAAAVFFGSAMALVVLCYVLWQAGGSQRAAAADRGEGGNATVEFTLVLPIVLVISLILIQSMMLMAGNICVHYAAFCAARCAVVTVPRNMPPNEIPNVVDLPGAPPKMQRIKDAAVWAVIPISNGSDSYPAADATDLQAGIKSLMEQYGVSAPAWVDRSLPHRLQYARDNTSVWLEHDPVDSIRNSWGPTEDIVVKVNHTLYLSVPLANRIFQVFGDTDAVQLGAGEYGMVIHAQCRLPNEGVQDWVDKEFSPTATPAPIAPPP